MDVKLTKKKKKEWELLRLLEKCQRTRTIPAIVLWEKRLKAIHRKVINLLVSIIVI